jgi:twinkle protein
MIFDNTVIEEQPPKLLEVIEDTIIKQDSKLVLIDNLMSGLRVRPNENLYQAQSDFVFSLTRIAKQYDTVILLVAHPRKSNGVFDNDDVSGSADITNLADVVMSYDIDKDREDVPDLRILRVTKNRLTGDRGNIDLWFDRESRRISDSQVGFSKNYFKGFTEIDEMEIPF